MPAGHSDPSTDPAFADRLRSIMSDRDRSDFELLDPPGDLWDRIVAAVGDTAHGAATGAGMVVEYTIDADDVVVRVGADWETFARENEAPQLAEPPTTRTLWSHFDSEEVRDLWRMLVDRVRAEQRPAQVPLRCDAPDARRWFEMTITPGPGGEAHFRSALVFEQARPGITLLTFDAERDQHAPEVPICDWCAKGYDGTGWLEIEELVRTRRLLEGPMPPIRHGICSECRALMSSDLDVSGEAGGSGA